MSTRGGWENAVDSSLPAWAALGTSSPDHGLSEPQSQEFDASPSAASLIEGLRDFGYTLETAVADILDNSLSAGAQTIHIFADTDGENPQLAILDDGTGMSPQELREAMRPGSKSPLDTRAADDLGRFGLGLKTASFSQCRRLTVATRKSGVLSTAVWDLDYVAATNRWLVQIPTDPGTIPWIETLNSNGTLVVWEKLDRIKGHDTPSQVTRNFVRKLDDVADHLRLIFHRFLGPDRRVPNASILLNGRPLEPFDPFHRKHPATMVEPPEPMRFHDQEVTIQAFTLPHHSKVSNSEWEEIGGPEGHVRNQGFYVYRSGRLIVWGTWFGLGRQTEATKLSRVMIDIPNGMDDLWQINVLKAAASPPSAVRERLRIVLGRISGASKRIYRQRGAKQRSGAELPLWVRVQEKDKISYGLEPSHPALEAFSEGLSDHQRAQLRVLLRTISSSMPLDSLLADAMASPQQVQGEDLDPQELEVLVHETCARLRAADVSWERVGQMMQSSPPFDNHWAPVKELIRRISEEDGA